MMRQICILSRFQSLGTSPRETASLRYKREREREEGRQWSSPKTRRFAEEPLVSRVRLFVRLGGRLQSRPRNPQALSQDRFRFASAAASGRSMLRGSMLLKHGPRIWVSDDG